MGNAPLPAQTEVFGALNELMGDEDVVINAAGSMPGDLQALWQAKTPVQYHVEYAFSCMGYEVPAAMGVKLARPESEVVSIVGDGTYQMLPMELATVAQEGIKVIYVLLQNYGFASIGALSESRGSQRFGTKYRQRGTGSHLEDTDTIAGVDIAANARRGASTCSRSRRSRSSRRHSKAAAPRTCDHDPHRDRPDGPQPARILLVGRRDLGGVRARVDPACVRGLPERSQAAAPLPVMR